MSRRRSIVIDIDGEVAEAVVRLGDHVDSKLRHDFLEKVFSILLCGLIDAGRDITADFEETSTMALHDDPMHGQMSYAVLWGEWIQLKEVFIQRHSKFDVTIDALAWIAEGRREVAAEMFDVHYSRGGDTLTVR